MKKRELIFVYVIAGLLGFWLVSKAIFGPFQEKLRALSREASLSQERLKKGISLMEKKDTIDKEYGRYADYFSLQKVSDEEATAVFLKEVERISRESGVTILDMKPQKETHKDTFSKKYLINIKAEANSGELVNFLYALHHAKLLFSVEKLVLAPKSEENSDLNVSIALGGVSFL